MGRSHHSNYYIRKGSVECSWSYRFEICRHSIICGKASRVCCASGDHHASTHRIFSRWRVLVFMLRIDHFMHNVNQVCIFFDVLGPGWSQQMLCAVSADDLPHVLQSYSNSLPVLGCGLVWNPAKVEPLMGCISQFLFGFDFRVSRCLFEVGRLYVLDELDKPWARRMRKITEG